MDVWFALLRFFLFFQRQLKLCCGNSPRSFIPIQISSTIELVSVKIKKHRR